MAKVSDPGGRSSNEDCAEFAVRGERACFVLADGLGGYQGAAVASAIAVRALLAALESTEHFVPATLNLALEHANGLVLDAQNRNNGYTAMRTTAAVLWVDGARAIWGHAGDTRIYLFRDGKVARQTKDHSVPQVLVAAGELTPEQIRFHDDRASLLKSLGTQGSVSATVEPEPVPLLPGDAFLLATDGFWELIEETEMERELGLSASATEWVQKMTAVIRSRLKENADNYSAIAVMLPGAGDVRL